MAERWYWVEGVDAWHIERPGTVPNKSLCGRFVPYTAPRRAIHGDRKSACLECQAAKGKVTGE